MRVLCGLKAASAVSVALLAAAVSASADELKLIPNVPRLKLFASSHSTATAEVMAYHGVKKELPQVVVIGGLEARIYRCECGKGIDLWDIAAGTKQWAGAEGLQVNTQARVLRGPWNEAAVASRAPDEAPQANPPATAVGDSSLAPGMTASAGAAGPDPGQFPQPGAAPSTGSGQVVPRSDGDRLDFAQYREVIDAGRPVVLTYSLDEASAKGMEASFRSQQRVSVVGVGYRDDDTARNPPEGGQPSAPTISSPSRCVVALLPEGTGKEKRFAQLAALPGVKQGETEGLLLIPWDIQTGNLIATFLQVAQ